MPRKTVVPGRRTNSYMSTRFDAEDKTVLGCVGCALFAYALYALAFIGFWVIVALALIHYIGH